MNTSKNKCDSSMNLCRLLKKENDNLHPGRQTLHYLVMRFFFSFVLSFFFSHTVVYRCTVYDYPLKIWIGSLQKWTNIGALKAVHHIHDFDFLKTRIHLSFGVICWFVTEHIVMSPCILIHCLQTWSQYLISNLVTLLIQRVALFKCYISFSLPVVMENNI